jgi:hypothetical protein
MSGRHETISDFEKMGSQMGSASQAQFPYEPRIHQENDSLNSEILDPIQRLPPEISTIIIQHTLPPDGRYSPQLLDLTAVSPIWRNFLLSTPVLWSEVYFNDRQPDFLATAAVFVHLSGDVALKVIIYNRPINSWPGVLSILVPVRARITNLTVLDTGVTTLYDTEGRTETFSAVYDFLHYLGNLPHLHDLSFVERAKSTITVFDSLDLPSTIHLSGALRLPMPPRAGSSVTLGRFFNIDKYNSFRGAPVVTPLFRNCTLSLGWSHGEDMMTVRMWREKLSDLKVPSKFIHEHFTPATPPGPDNSRSQTVSTATKLGAGTSRAEYGLERFTYIIGTSLCYLAVGVSLSQVGDLVNFLRILTRLESLSLEIKVSETEETPDVAPGSIVVPNLQRLFAVFTNLRKLPILTVTHGLRGLFSAFALLYPGVESLTLRADTWPRFASSYLESLRKLKYLELDLRSARDDSQNDTLYNVENHSITLYSLEQLELQGRPLIHRLRTPNLLSLRLEPSAPIAHLECLGTSSLRKLTIRPTEGGGYTLNPPDYPVISELNLGMYNALKPVDVLSFSSLSSIRLKSKYFTNPEGNQLCIALLCNPEGCPSLQELHFKMGLEWDILVLMLERRNFGLKGVRRIHTVTLRYIPFFIHQTLTPLLAGERAERPSLESISLEATREVLFDATV